VHGISQKINRALCIAIASIAGWASAEETVPAVPLEVLISVPEQKLVVLRDGGLIAKYKISTSKFGVGDSFGSYKTPLGRLRVCEKIGDACPLGTVMKHRTATSEVLPANAPGRDPIVTRIIWLDGLDDQNRNARARGIYIHGTPEEKKIGAPVSWGCIRMKSLDVVALYNDLPVGTIVNISPDKLPKLRKYVPPPPVPPVQIAKNPEPAPAASVKKAAQPAESVKKSAPLPEIASGPVRGDKGASQAMKGSILNSGLPDAPTQPRIPTPAAGSRMAFRSWSAELRGEAESGKPNTPH
jgi:hypothetical protein